MGLFYYLKGAQRLLRDQRQDAINPEDFRDYINEARREVAMRAQCLPVLTPISGSIIGWSVTNGGSTYSNNPTLTITAPDFPSGTLPYPNGQQATAQAIVQGGVITAIDSSFGGYGYYQPGMTITDTTGTGATATPIMSYISQLNPGQEVYPFSAVNLSAFPGIGSIFMIRSVSILYSNYRYSLACPSFSVYQGLIRNYPNQFEYTPIYCAQFGRGTSGSFYMYPLPQQAYQLEFHALCLPQDLQDDQSVDVIPAPWVDAVKFFAAHLAMLEIQNMNAAVAYLQMFDQYMKRYGSYVNSGRIQNMYGRSIT
jgi:hypothetical protein